jgi:hypothetical protein
MLHTLASAATAETRILWILIIVLGSLVIALIAGMLHNAGTRTANAILYGGGSFIATATVTVLILQQLQIL